MKKTIALLAGELSGDILGAAIAEALWQQDPALRLIGVTGPRMVAAGVESIGSIETLSIMGIAEVLPALPRLLAFKQQLLQRLLSEKVEVVVGIDAPDFNLRIEKALKSKGIKTVHVVSPTVWAWRKGRVRGIAKAADLLLCLFPFEPAYYRGVMRAEYIGHPLAEQLNPATTPAQGRVLLGLSQGLTVALLPGSRGGEVKVLAPIFAEVVRRMVLLRPAVQFVLPIAKPSLKPLLEGAFTGLPVYFLTGQSREALQASDVVLLASGTATLETLLLGRPMLIAYKVSAFTAWLVRRLAVSDKAGLPNHLGADVPEFLQERCTAEYLLPALLKLLDQPEARHQQTQAFANIAAQLRQGAGAKAAQQIRALLN
jgi:lipid-A-disaccharide synthase